MKPAAILFGLLALLISINADSAILVVDSQGSGTFLKIQDALDYAEDGDEIIVYPGTYVENLDFLGKKVYLHSAFGPEVTIVDGSSGVFPEQSCVKFNSSETPESIFEGLRLQGGRGTFFADATRGAGAFCVDSHPTIRGCEFVDNECEYAAAIYIAYGGATIMDCIFSDNFAETYGSAVAGPNGQAVKIQDCLFEDNIALTGGGAVHLTSTAIIEDCTFRRNRSHSGAAINSPSYGADFYVTGCVFEENRAHGWHGGAIRVHEASPHIEYCLFVGNSSNLDGGAIITLDGSQTTIKHCTFYRNLAERYGGALAFWDGSVPRVENNIIAESTLGAGVFCSDAYPQFTCNDAWNNSGGNYWGCADPTGTNGNISADPLFCAPEAGNFMLHANSPCAPDNNPECGLIGAFGVGCAAASAGDRDIAWAPRLSVGPNPFKGSVEIRLRDVPDAASREGDLRIEIYTPAGRRLWSESVSREGASVVWRGLDGSGRNVPSGVYYLRMLHRGEVLEQRSIVRID